MRRAGPSWAVAVGIGVAVVAAEALICRLLAAPGARLRPWVDLLTVQGIVLALAGAFLITGRPFLAARAAAGRPAGDSGGPSSRRRVGVAVFAAGALLFSAAWVVWSVFGGS